VKNRCHILQFTFEILAALQPAWLGQDFTAYGAHSKVNTSHDLQFVHKNLQQSIETFTAVLTVGIFSHILSTQ